MSDLGFRSARPEDVPALVALLVEDPLGAARESPDEPERYVAALDRMSGPDNQLVVAELDGRVVGMLQLTVVPGFSRRGAVRSVIEAVRVSAALRGQGLGAQLVTWAVEESRRRGCSLVQLTSDASRPEAHRFYERLGFVASHVGFKRQL